MLDLSNWSTLSTHILLCIQALSFTHSRVFVSLRIAGSLRRGAAADIGLEKFVEAVKDSSTGLTYPALTGVPKQSVEDV